MSKEESLLPLEMGKLEIEPVKPIITGSEENPFNLSLNRSSLFSKTFKNKYKCNCLSHRKPNITIPIYKKKTNKLIKEPSMHLAANISDCTTLPATRYRKKITQPFQRNSVLCISSQDESYNLCSLVDNCNQLSISSDCGASTSLQLNNNSTDKNWTGISCSQEALNPPCDVTIDELASYFETLVHIPKKMSSMAEMMYI